MTGGVSGVGVDPQTVFKPGNAEELAFLDELAGVPPKEEDKSENTGTSMQPDGTVPLTSLAGPASVTLAALKQGNADALAFLDELAGATAKEEGAAGTRALSEGTAVTTSAAGVASVALNALKQGNADELAFLNELAGSAPKEEEAANTSVGIAAETDLPEQHVEAATGIQADVASDVKKEEDKEDEETYERDATELLNAFTDGKGEDKAVDDLDVFQDFMNELRSVDRDNEVNRILWAFKLNPFEKMNLHFDATEADVRKQYRKISLLIHPDKCSHPQAAEAFEVLQLAQKELLNEEVRTSLLRVLEFARDKVREERRKATKHDSALRLATYLHGKGREGVEEDWEQTDDFHEKWKMTSRDVLAKAEFRKRKLNKRIREEEERVTIEEKEEAKERKKARKEKQQWLEKRTDRIDSWRDWTANKGLIYDFL